MWRPIDWTRAKRDLTRRPLFFRGSREWRSARLEERFRNNRTQDRLDIRLHGRHNMTRGHPIDPRLSPKGAEATILTGACSDPGSRRRRVWRIRKVDSRAIG